MGSDVVILTRIPFTIPFIDTTFNFVITDVMVVSWVIMGCLILWAFLATMNMKAIPAGLQNSAEIVVDSINNFTKNIIGEKHYRMFAPYIGTLGLYLLFSNIIGALFFVKPPTRSFGIPVALALMTIVLTIIGAIKCKGLKGWLGSFVKPLWIMFPFNVLEYAIKPLSLSMRLYGNIYGAAILMHMLESTIVAPPIACLYFDLFDGGLQAFVFVLLTTLYVAEAVEVEE